MSSGTPDNCSPKRPAYRPAEGIDAEEFTRAIATDDPEKMSLALIDGSRCLDSNVVFPVAFRLLQHASQQVRAGSLFAMEQTLSSLGDDAWSPEIWESLSRLAVDDADEYIRHSAVDILRYSLTLAADVVGNAAKGPPNRPQARVALEALRNAIEVHRRTINLLRSNPTQ
ncbi:MAG: hypothetical protein ACKVS8_07400 [Phycisphaerales bacterium]